ncbi:MAG: universal stress protein [Anaerolineae bacterium]|nr:universal stress protein [Anaerolineae bacterium]MBN8617675.1 universal stress protein [Anaerolineae bacterium]
MLKHVLVPLDGSQLAEEALNHALSILEPTGRLTLISAVEVPDVPVYGYYPPVTIPDYETTKNDLLPYAKHYLEGIADKLMKQGYTVVTEATLGDPADVIVKLAEKHQVEAIVMSTHGRSGINRWLFGSVTNKVLNAKPCPVYVIPSREPKTKETKEQGKVPAGA